MSRSAQQMQESSQTCEAASIPRAAGQVACVGLMGTATSGSTVMGPNPDPFTQTKFSQAFWLRKE